MKISQLLARDQNGGGDLLDDEEQYSLNRYSMELQMTLLALGMTSAQLEQSVKHFSHRLRRIQDGGDWIESVNKNLNTYLKYENHPN